ncbi:L-fucose:H+ symporter permease [Marinomonas hwangdonensis]|uniref:L-fucose:H+ symporter permease n=1 Tax=Marinomonas hwangdonensis TaxID=1053647 RepID=A0A3M8QAH0_9GAMM|nr:L-fucose:H+ symporter permease [Marinomonas hwangdonensis]RNF53057.1 L-fucose:H+ symporter permease [Marinomonas hwangdonensis]
MKNQNTAPQESLSAQFVYPNMKIAFILLITCFAAWGVAANMTDPLVKVFSKIFTMSTFESALVQFAYYGAYFCLALPAAFINARYSYKAGVLTGLALAILGALAFYPASVSMTYGFFLAALFILAAGLSILETSANPFVMAMGPEGSATRRLNLAQAFNPVGTNIGVFLAATLILPNLNVATAEDRANMAPEMLRDIQSAELHGVMTPYVGMAFVLMIIWVLIYFMRVPKSTSTVKIESIEPIDFKATLCRLFARKQYRWGVVAQFFNVAAQTCTWTFTIQYVQETLGGTEASASDYLQYSLLIFLVSRFVMTWLMGYFRPAVLLTILAVLGSLLCLYAVMAPGVSGVWAIVSISACLSLMFPTIYGIALNGLDKDTKFGSAGLVMAILGGAIMPLVQGATIDEYGAIVSYVVPAVCFLVVAFYGLFSVKNTSV